MTIRYRIWRKFSRLWIKIHRIDLRPGFSSLSVRYGIVIVGGLIIISGIVTAFLVLTRQQDVHLVIVYTGDLKGDITCSDSPLNYAGDNSSCLGGLDVVAKIVADLRRKYGHENVILIDTGDALWGSFEVGYLQQQTRSFGQDMEVNPMLRLMALSGYNVVALGNVDLESDVKVLKRTFRDLQQEGHNTFQIICSNLLDKTSGSPYFASSSQMQVDGLRVKVVASITEMSREMVPEARLAELDIQNEEVALWNEINDPENRADVNLIITHSERAFAIAKALGSRKSQGINVVIAGNLVSPSLFYPEEAEGVIVSPAVYSGSSPQGGHEIGILHLTIDQEKITLLESSLERRQIDRDEWGSDAQVAESISEHLNEISDAGDRRLEISIPIDVIPYGESGNLAGPSPMGNLVTDAMRVTSKADIAFLNSLAIRGGLDQNGVTVRDLWKALPFDDHIVVVWMSGEDIESVLRRNAYLPYSFLQLSGAHQEFQYYNGTLRQEVRLLDGTLVQPDKLYKVSLTDFLLRGGDGITVRGKPILEIADSTSPKQNISVGPLLRDAVIEYLESNEFALDLEPRFVFDQGSEEFTHLIELRRLAAAAFAHDEITQGFMFLLEALDLRPGDPMIEEAIVEQLAIKASEYLTGEMFPNQEIEFLDLIENHFPPPSSAISQTSYIRRLTSVLKVMAGNSMSHVQDHGVPLSAEDFDVIMLWSKVLVRTERYDEARDVLKWLDEHSQNQSDFRRAELLIYQGIVEYNIRSSKQDLLAAEDMLRSSFDYDNSLILERVVFLGRISQDQGKEWDALNFYRLALTLDGSDPYHIQNEKESLESRVRNP